MKRQKRFHKLFFREDIQLQSLKIACPRSQRTHGQVNFSFKDFRTFKLLLLGV